MYARSRLREHVASRLRSVFPEYDVTEDMFLKIGSAAKAIVVWVESDEMDDEEESLDGDSPLNVALKVQSAAVGSKAQSVLDERMEKAQNALLDEEFLLSSGAVGIVYSGYEFEPDEGYATGVATFVVQIYEEASR